MCILLVASSRPALADATLFIGANTTPSTRTAKGFAIGVGLVAIGIYRRQQQLPPAEPTEPVTAA